MGSERGQGTVEWVGLVCLVSLALVGTLVAGVRLPGVDLARSVAQRILCAAELADGCGDEPLLIATYGDEVGRLVRRHMPTIGFEVGSRAVPVDYRRCRETECGDAPEDGLVHRTDERLPVSAFVHVIDCRPEEREQSEAAGDDCSDQRAENLYIEYFLFYANSAGFSSSKRVRGFSSNSRHFVLLIGNDSVIFRPSGNWLRHEISETRSKPGRVRFLAPESEKPARTGRFLKNLGVQVREFLTSEEVRRLPADQRPPAG